MVDADKTQMNRLFTNLFANAVEACSGRQCKIEVLEADSEVGIRISIKDNGEGIPPEMQVADFQSQLYHQIIRYRSWSRYV